MKKEIERLDKPNASLIKVFSLKKASAQQAATLIQNFWTQRYVNEGVNQHEIRVTYDNSANELFVQAAPADMEDIASLVERLDTAEPTAPSTRLRVVRLKNALADELTSVLLQALRKGCCRRPAASSRRPTTPGGAGGAAGGFGGAAGGGLGGAGGAAARMTSSITTKTVSLRFLSATKDAAPLQSGYAGGRPHHGRRADRTAIVISAPAKTLPLLLAVIADLDRASAASAVVNVFHAEEGRRRHHGEPDPTVVHRAAGAGDAGRHAGGGPAARRPAPAARPAAWAGWGPPAPARPSTGRS